MDVIKQTTPFTFPTAVAPLSFVDPPKFPQPQDSPREKRKRARPRKIQLQDARNLDELVKAGKVINVSEIVREAAYQKSLKLLERRIQLYQMEESDKNNLIVPFEERRMEIAPDGDHSMVQNAIKAESQLLKSYLDELIQELGTEDKTRYDTLLARVEEQKEGEEKRLSEVESKIGSTIEKLQATYSYVDQLTKWNAERRQKEDEETQQRRQQLNAIETHLGTLRDQLESQEVLNRGAIVHEMEQYLTEKNKIIDELGLQVSDLEQKLGSVTENVEGARADFGGFKEEVMGRLHSTEEIVARLDEFGERLGELASVVTPLTERIDYDVKQASRPSKSLSQRVDFSFLPDTDNNEGIIGRLRRYNEILLPSLFTNASSAQGAVQADSTSIFQSTKASERLAKLFPGLGVNSPEIERYYATKLPYIWRSTQSEEKTLEAIQFALSRAARTNYGEEVVVDPTLDNAREVLYWVKNQKGTDADIYLRHKNNLEDFIGAQQFKVGQSRVYAQTLDQLMRETFDRLVIVGDRTKRKDPQIAAFMSALDTGIKENKKGLGLVKKAVADYNAAAPEPVDEGEVEEEVSGAAADFRDLLQRFIDLSKDKEKVERVATEARNQLKQNTQEYNDVMNIVKQNEVDPEQVPVKVQSLKENVETILNSLKAEKEDKKERERVLRQDLERHKSEVERLVKSLWTREAVEQIPAAARISSGRFGARVKDVTAVPRARATPKKEPPKKAPVKKGSLWERAMAKYRRNR